MRPALGAPVGRRTTLTLAVLVLCEVVAGVGVAGTRRDPMPRGGSASASLSQMSAPGTPGAASSASPSAVAGSTPAASSSTAASVTTAVAPAHEPNLALRAVTSGTGDNIVIQWNDAAVEAVRRSRLGPPMVSRALAIIHTCMYDAWAAYDATAVGTRLGGGLRQPPDVRDLDHRVEAISFAAYRAAADLFPAQSAGLFDPLMARLGLNAGNRSTRPDTAAGVGNAACQAVLDYRHHDGANQLGDHPAGKAGTPYSDYTGYRPVNDPMDLRREFDPRTVHDPGRWQPLTYVDQSGAVVTPAFLAPFWGHVVPFAMASSSSLRSPVPPAAAGSPEGILQALDVLNESALLTDEHKMISEYWADGPRTETPPGHWNLFARFVSRRDNHGTGAEGVASDVKMFFALNNAMLDAGIAAWDNKVAFDSVRPITAIRNQFRGLQVLAWGGPYQGTKLIYGQEWLPYQASTFPTPPFSEYSSGHSNFSNAAAQVLRDFTGSDSFGLSVTRPAGSSTIEPGTTPAADVTLSWATFSDAAAQAGLSRRYGGIHFKAGDLDARATGKACGQLAWAKAVSYFTGTAG